MKYSYSAGGYTQPCVKEFEIQNDAFVEKGQAVCATDGIIGENTKGGTFVGICDETHTGKPDILNERADKNKVRVVVSPDAVYATAPITVTCTAKGTGTTVTASADGIDANLVKGATVVLSGKGASSVNDGKIGNARKVVSCTVSGETATLTLSEGETSDEGDIYEIYPAMGTKMYLDENKNGVVFANTNTDVSFKTVGFDINKKEVFVKGENMLFA